MAIRTTIVNKTKNADGTYSEKEIHPFTDMNAVVSLEAVSGNYDAYTSLPLEGAPQNALTAFLNTRSYLYSLRNFKNKTVTDNFTETTNLTTKVPSMQAFVDGYNTCQKAALNAYNHASDVYTEVNNNANTRIPKTSITNDYDVSSPSDSLVLSQTGANNLYLQSFVNNLILTILNAPRGYVSPFYFNDYFTSKDKRNYVSDTNTMTDLDIFYGGYGPNYSGSMVSSAVFYKVTVFRDLDNKENINNFLREGAYNINDIYRGGSYDYYYSGYGIPRRGQDSGITDIIGTPEIYEEMIIAIVHQFTKPQKIYILYDGIYSESLRYSSMIKSVKNTQVDKDHMRTHLIFKPHTSTNNVPVCLYTLEYCDMKIDGKLADLLAKHVGGSYDAVIA